MHAKSVFAGAAALLLTISTSAFAQSAPQPPPSAPPTVQAPATLTPAEAPSGKRGPRGGALADCRADVQALCPGVGRGGKMLDCLAENRAKASPQCQSAMQAVLDKRSTTGGQKAAAGGGQLPKRLSACEVDLATHCGSVSTEKGGRMRCLKQNEAKLAPDCAATLKQISETGQRLQQACAGDRQTLCGSAERGPATLQCLQTNQAKLSPSCSAAMAEMPSRKRVGSEIPPAAQVAPKP